MPVAHLKTHLLLSFAPEIMNFSRGFIRGVLVYFLKPEPIKFEWDTFYEVRGWAWCRKVSLFKCLWAALKVLFHVFWFWRFWRSAGVTLGVFPEDFKEVLANRIWAGDLWRRTRSSKARPIQMVPGSIKISRISSSVPEMTFFSSLLMEIFRT